MEYRPNRAGVPHESAGQGLTHLAAVTSVPCIGSGSWSCRTLRLCWACQGASRARGGLSRREGVLRKLSAVRPRATLRAQEGHTHRTTGRQHAHSALCSTQPHAVIPTLPHSHTPTLPHSHTPSLTRSLAHSLTRSHSLPLTLTQSSKCSAVEQARLENASALCSHVSKARGGRKCRGFSCLVGRPQAFRFPVL